MRGRGPGPQGPDASRLRHSFVSLMSAAGVPLEDIARLVGHRGPVVTEAVYRKQLRPLLTEGAEAMNQISAISSLRNGTPSVVRH